jgi:hypothetical protein
MQATAMGETIYLAFFIWTVVFFSDFMGGNDKALMKSGLCLAAACLTRYDGWFLAVVMIIAVAARLFWSGASEQQARHRENQRRAAVRFILIAVSAPVLWLAYNGIVYRNPIEFANGPYSAKAIERKTEAAGNPGHPGERNPIGAGLYFLKAAEVNLAEPTWLQRLWVLLGLAAIGCAKFAARSEAGIQRRAQWSTLLLLLVPWPFYALSVAQGGVPIFVPPWWPFSYYNVRYGLQLLPAFAVAIAVTVFLSVRWFAPNNQRRLVAVLAICAFVAVSDASTWSAGPVCLREAQVNMATKTHFERELADWLKHLPPDSTLLMYLGDHVGALEQAAIPLRRVINEGNHRVWKQPIDAEGLWERALANPSGYADYVVAFEGDPVWKAVQPLQLRELVEIHVTGQARAVVYRPR